MGRHLLKYTLYAIAGLIGLLLLLFLSLQLPAVQQSLTERLQSYLRKKIDTEVRVDKIRIGFPDEVIVEGVYLEDLDGDTLAAIGHLSADIFLWKLISKKIKIEHVELDNASVHIITDSSGVANYNFIVEAFTTPDTTTATKDTLSSGTGWEFQLPDASAALNEIDFYFKNEISGQLINARLGKADIRIAAADIDSNFYNIKNVELQNGRVDVVWPVDTTPAATGTAAAFRLDLQNVALDNVNASYDITDVNMNAAVHKLRLENFHLTAADSLLLQAGVLDIAESDVTIVNPNVPATAGFDPNHLQFKNLNIDIRNFLWSGDDISVDINKIALLEAHSGFMISDMRSRLQIDTDKISLNQFNFQTPQSSIIADFRIDYPVFAPAHPDIERIYLDARFQRSAVSVDDILALFPAMADSLTILENSRQRKIRLSGLIEGTLTDLRFDKFELEGLKGFEFIADGQLKHITDPKQMAADINISKFWISKAAMQSLLPDSILPGRKQPPDFLSLNGSISGNMDTLNTAVKIRAERDTALTELVLNGTIYNLKAQVDSTLPGKTAWQIPSLQLNTTRTEIINYLPPQTLPEEITLPEKFTLEGSLNGDLNAVDMDLLFSGLRHNLRTDFYIEGSVANIQNPANIQLKVKIKSPEVQPQELRAYLPDTVVPDYFKINPLEELTLSFEGERLSSPAGRQAEMHFDGEAAFTSGSETWYASVRRQAADYKVDFEIEQFDLYYWIDTSDFKLPFTKPVHPFTLKVEGTASHPDSLKIAAGQITAVVSNLQIGAAAIGTVRIRGDMAQQQLTFQTTAAHNSLNFDLEGDMNFSKANPGWSLRGAIHSIDLQQLSLSQEPLALSGNINGDFKGLSPDSLQGNFTGSGFYIDTKNSRYYIDQLQTDIHFDGAEKSLNFNSEMLTASLKGNFLWKNVSTAMDHLLDHYWLPRSRPSRDHPQVKATLEMELLEPDILESLLPQLSKLEPFRAKAEIDVAAHTIRLNTRIPSARYANVRMDSIYLLVDSDKDKITYNLSGLDLLFGEKKYVSKLKIKGDASEGLLHSDMVALDSADKMRLALKADLENLGDRFRLHLSPEQIIQYNTWTLPADNRLVIGADSIDVQSMIFNYKNQSLQLESINKDELKIAASNVNLGDLAGNFRSGESVLDGRLNGEIHLRDILTSVTVLANLNVDNLVVLGAGLGNTVLQITSPEANRYEAMIDIKGAGNDVELRGGLTTTASVPVSGNLRISSLNLEIIEGLSLGYLRNVEGTLSGGLEIAGNLETPKVTGELNFDKAAFTLNMFKTRLVLPDETVQFVNGGVRIHNMRLKDGTGNSSILSGMMHTETYRTFHLDLSWKAARFLVLNTTKADSDLYYGKLIVDVDATVSGTFTEPFIKGFARARDGSDLTYIYQQGGLASAASPDGVVRFVTPGIPPRIEEKKKKIDQEFPFRLDLDLEINENVGIHIVLDPITGDKFDGQTEGTLSLALFPNGKIEIYGQAVVQDGTYIFTYNDIIKRKFSVQKGSKVVWSGDAFQPSLDITAWHEVKTSPVPLIIQFQSSLSEQELTEYSRRQIFEVVFNITGTPDAPEIEMRVRYDKDATGNADYSDKIAGAIASLNAQENSRTTQAFALLLFQGFLTDKDNPTDFQVVDLEGSLTNIVSRYLNNITTRYLGLSLDVSWERGNEFNPDAASNSLRIGASKSFFNDRLEVKVDGVTELEGQKGQQQVFIDNLSLSYKLDEAGNLKIKVNREYQSDEFLGERIIVTGASLVLTKEFENWKKIFEEQQEN